MPPPRPLGSSQRGGRRLVVWTSARAAGLWQRLRPQRESGRQRPGGGETGFPLLLSPPPTPALRSPSPTRATLAPMPQRTNRMSLFPSPAGASPVSEDPFRSSLCPIAALSQPAPSPRPHWPQLLRPRSFWLSRTLCVRPCPDLDLQIELF